ncbi:MAG: hypothetical protein WKF70_08430 [Chitinophagaceae bacterium]
MGKHNSAVTKTLLLYGCSIFLINFLLFSSCATTKPSGDVDRKQVPQIMTGVAHTSSEIRELAHLEVVNHSHVSLHFTGQLFLKSETAGNAEIKPCVRCIVTLKDRKDTTTTFNMVTEEDGYFEFFGSKNLFALCVTSPTGNRIEIDSLDLSVGGRNHMVIINATGSNTHKFTVTRTDRVFRWAAVQ